MRRFLVTGGCGFIGSHLCDALVAQGHDVTVIDDLSSGHTENLPPGCRLIRGDAADPETVAQGLRGVDGVFHLAAVASVARSNDEWRASHIANQTASVTVFEAARQAGGIPVVYTSSAAIYGNVGGRKAIAETRVAAPRSAYGVDKYGTELHAGVATRVHGVPTVGLRPFNVYGARQDPRSPYSGVISIFADLIASRRPVTVFGDGRQTRDFIHVSDVIRHYLAAMALRPSEPQVFNVASGTSTSLLALIGILQGIVGTTPELRFAPARPGDIRHSLGDATRARSVLGVPPALALEIGLASLFGSGPTMAGGKG